MTGFRATVLGVVALAGCNGDESPEGPARVEVAETSLDFGSVGVGSSEERRVEVRNTGGEDLEIRSVTLVQGDDGVWSWSRDPDGDVPGGGSIDLVVAFSPDVADSEETGRLQIRTSDTSSGPVLIDLTGAGAPSTIDGDEDGFSPADGDCNDDRADTYPGAPELCDGRDNDCDDEVPSNERDGDRDGVRVCEDDCDDDDDDVYPGAPEICDDKDSDCDGETPDRADADGDGYSLCDGDCLDDEPTVNPGAEELCDGLDNDCSGSADDVDADGDGRSVCKGDCDDSDEDAYSIAVDPGANPEEPDGSDDAPFRTFDEALAALEPTCHTIFLADETYTLSVELSDGADLIVQGESRDGVVLTPTEDGDGRVFTLSGSTLTLRDATLTGGSASGDGGAIEASFSDLTLERVDVTGNEGGADGGAVVVSSGTLTLRDVEATGNTAADDGGAFAVFSGTLDVARSTLTGNTGNRGGALLAEGGTVLISDSTISSNTARDKGGALQILGGSGHLVQRVVLADNTAATEGGALSLSEVGDPDTLFRNLEITENDGGDHGGGIAITGATSALRVANCTLTGNSASEGGSGIWVGSTRADDVDLVANIVAWNDGGGGIETVEGSGAVARYCLGYATSPGADFEGGVSVDDTGNISDLPRFSDWTDDGVSNDDLSLQSGSPAIDAGPPGASFDDLDGSQNDIGVTGGPGAE